MDRHCRCRYPQLFDDALQRQRLAALAANRTRLTVAVVGNAESVFQTAAGFEIDRCDLVIRINRGFVSRPDCQGSRTDILCLATKIPRIRGKVERHQPKFVLLTPRRWAVGRELLEDSAALACYPLDAWSELSRQIGGRRPSSGLMAIDLARRFLPAEQVKLFGFDWKATKTHYSRKLRLGAHDWPAERRLVLQWAEKGWLRLPPGFNLSGIQQAG